MSSLMQQLHDIEGLDAISFWPLAIGWWVSIAFGIVFFVIAFWLLKCRLNYLRSWKKDVLRKLTYLERNLSQESARETTALLSEYLRRIAMRRFPRKECAGLVGDNWLKWLKSHDPKQFDWTEKGKLLLEIPYAPMHLNLSLQEVKELIQATKSWVC